MSQAKEAILHTNAQLADRKSQIANRTKQIAAFRGPLSLEQANALTNLPGRASQWSLAANSANSRLLHVVLQCALFCVLCGYVFCSPAWPSLSVCNRAEHLLACLLARS